MRRHNALPALAFSATDLVRKIHDLSPQGIAPWGLHPVRRVTGRGAGRHVVYEDKPSQEWMDLPLYLKSRDPRAMPIDELADALGTDQAALVEALRTLPTARAVERGAGREGVGESDVARHLERRAERHAEAEAAAYERARQKHPRLASYGITDAHPHNLRVWHVGSEGGGEWFRPFGRLPVGISTGENPLMGLWRNIRGAPWLDNPLLLEYLNPPRVVGRIPGTLDEIRYHRTGRHRGPYKHRFTTPSTIHLVNNGGLYILPKRNPLPSPDPRHPRSMEPGWWDWPFRNLIALAEQEKDSAALYAFRAGEKAAQKGRKTDADWWRHAGIRSLHKMNPLRARGSRARFRHETVAPVPRGWRVRTVAHGSGVLARVAFPPGPRRKGAGRLVGLLRPKGNPEVTYYKGFKYHRIAVPKTDQVRVGGGTTGGTIRVEPWTFGKEHPAFKATHLYVTDTGGWGGNPAFSAYFVGRGGRVTEKYFRASGPQDAKAQIRAYAAAHGLKPSTLWKLQSTTRTGRRFAGEWARPLMEGGSAMAHRARHRHNDPGRRRHYRHRHNDPGRRRHHRHHWRHNPDVADVLRNPANVLTQAGMGVLGAFGVIAVGNYVGTFIPTVYLDTSITGKVTRAVTRGVVAYAADFATKGMNAASRVALQTGALIGIVGSFLFDVLGSTFALGPGDTAVSLANIMPGAAVTAGVYAYGGGRNRPIAGTGAYTRRLPHQTVTGLGEMAMGGMTDALMYHPMR